VTLRGLGRERIASRAVSKSQITTAFAFAAVTLVLAPVAYMAMFTGFHAYDDEGYFLIVLRDYLSGQPLLNSSVPIYGPFFFETMGGLFKLLGVAPSHESGRYVTLAIWLVASLLAGLTAYRLTRSAWLGLGAELVAFQLQHALTNEPMSPTGLIGLLLVAMAAAASFRSVRPRATAVVIGAIVGALCLIKINVGGFAAIAVAFAWAGGLAPRWGRVLFPLLVVVITLLPPVLMASLLSRDWVVEYALLLALSGAAVGIARLAAANQPQPPVSGFALAGGGAILVVVCLGIALAGGTQVEDLWNGLVVVSLRFPRLFTLPLQINPAVDFWALVMVGAAVATRGRLSASTAGIVRIAAGLFTWLSALLIPSSVFLLALPLTWIACVPPAGRGDDPVDGYCRLLLPALSVTEALQVYPVAGAQLAMAALCLVPVGAVMVIDGIRQLRSVGLGRPWRVAASVAPAALLVNVLACLLFANVVAAGFRAGTPLGVAGAESIRVPPQQASELQSLTAAIDRDCSEFITLPGMNSLYLWAAQSPPTDVRAEIWMLTLDDSQQQSLVRQLEDLSRLCVVKNQVAVDFWVQGRRVQSGPLLEFINLGFVSGGTFGDYQLLVRRDR